MMRLKSSLKITFVAISMIVAAGAQAAQNMTATETGAQILAGRDIENVFVSEEGLYLISFNSYVGGIGERYLGNSYFWGSLNEIFQMQSVGESSISNSSRTEITAVTFSDGFDRRVEFNNVDGKLVAHYGERVITMRELFGSELSSFKRAFRGTPPSVVLLPADASPTRVCVSVRRGPAYNHRCPPVQL